MTVLTTVFRHAMCRVFGHNLGNLHQVGLFYSGVALYEAHCQRCDRLWRLPVYPSPAKTVGAVVAGEDQHLGFVYRGTDGKLYQSKVCEDA